MHSGKYLIFIILQYTNSIAGVMLESTAEKLHLYETLLYFSTWQQNSGSKSHGRLNYILSVCWCLLTYIILAAKQTATDQFNRQACSTHDVMTCSTFSFLLLFCRLIELLKWASHVFFFFGQFVAGSIIVLLFWGFGNFSFLFCAFSH